MKKLLILLLLCAVTAEAGALKYVGPVSAGTGAGTSWANRAKADSTWFRTVTAGDTVLFYPGFYDSMFIVPPERTHGVMTYYWAGDGITNQPYDPGVASLSSSFSRLDFNTSLQLPKLCTLTAGFCIPTGATWTNYSGSVYYTSVTLPYFYQWGNCKEPNLPKIYYKTSLY